MRCSAAAEWYTVPSHRTVEINEVCRRIRRFDEGLLRRGVGHRHSARVDDALRQKIGHRLAMTRPIRSENVIEGPILADQHNDVLDRRRRVALVFTIVVIGCSRQARDRGDQRAAKSRRHPQAISVVRVSKHLSPPLVFDEDNGSRAS
jgi:hypothetical protein